jgi:hypothetical protein
VISNSLLNTWAASPAAGSSPMWCTPRRTAGGSRPRTRYFPIEPHWFFPGFQFMPLPMRISITRAWPLGYRRAKTREQAYELVQEVELVTITEMRKLFPEGDLWKERMAGLVKSLVAVRT